MASDKDHTDQSALINLDSLEVTRKRKPGQASFEESGLIDLSGFTGGGPAETRETAGVPSGGPVAASFVMAPRRSNTMLYVILAAVVLLLLVAAVGLGVMLARQGGEAADPVQPVAQQTPPTTPPAAAPPAAGAAVAPPADPAAAAAPPATSPDGGVAAAAADGGTAEDSPALAANRPTARPGRGARPGAATPAPARPTPSSEDTPPPVAAAAPTRQPDPPSRPKPAATSEVDDMLSALDGKPAATGGGATGGAAPTQPVADSTLPAALDRRQILTVVKQNAGGVAKCKSQPPGSSSTVLVKMQIAGNGNVTGADVAAGPLKGTAQGNCIERTVKVFRFPQFSGPPMQINMPFAM